MVLGAGGLAKLCQEGGSVGVQVPGGQAVQGRERALPPVIHIYDYHTPMVYFLKLYPGCDSSHLHLCLLAVRTLGSPWLCLMIKGMQDWLSLVNSF